MTFQKKPSSWPAYLETYESGVLDEKVEKALSMLSPCRVCPRECDVNRLENGRGVCMSGRYAMVSSYFSHFGEEDCLRGWKGSGTIFFSHCNLKCVFCQNFDISQRHSGVEVVPEQLAKMMLELQEKGCHNINFVTPEHVVPQIVEALPIAIQGGLRLPLVYNTGSFDSLESLEIMEGLVDIYMPDFKIWEEEMSKRYLKSARYPVIARAAIREMYRQVGDLQFDERGLAVRGLLVRHLVMPGMLDDSRSIFEFLSSEVSPDTFVNIMNQYRPAHRVGETSYKGINRPTSTVEFHMAVEAAEQAGLRRFDDCKPPLLAHIL
ncbi:MAG: radical SAM protein [Candidatus Neomarinimicrobiota bacterium]